MKDSSLAAFPGGQVGALCQRTTSSILFYFILFYSIVQHLVCLSKIQLTTLLLPYRIQALDDVILVGGSTRIPAVQRLVKIITGVDPRRTVNPDEAVSLGAIKFTGYCIVLCVA